MEKLDGTQASWLWTRPAWCEWDVARWPHGRMSCMSTPRTKPPGWMGEGWALVVSCLDCFQAFTSLTARAGFFMHFLSPSTATSNSRARKGTSRMWSWCQDGEPTSQRTSTRSTLQITLMNQRLVLTIWLARTDQFSGRSIHANLNTMHSINSRICHLWGRFGHLLKTLPNMQKRSGRPEEGWKVRYFDFYIFIHWLHLI